MPQTPTEFDRALSQAAKILEADLYFFSMAAGYYSVTVFYHYASEEPSEVDKDDLIYIPVHFDRSKVWTSKEIAVQVADHASAGTPNPLLI